MRKSTIFISAVLTTFTLAMLYGVVHAYQNISNPQQAALPATNTPSPEPLIEPTATPAMITPEQAAQVAAQVVGNSNLLSAESSSFNGINAYLITFTNRDVVYVGLDGQVLNVQIAPVVMNVSVPVQVKHKEKDKDEDRNTANSDSENDDESEDD